MLRNPDFIVLEGDAILTPLSMDDEISSLSAILLNESYYELLKNGQMILNDSKDIEKHKNDVFRLAQLITADTKQMINTEIADDMRKFLSEIEKEDIDLKSIGIRGVNKATMIELLYHCCGLNK